MASEGGGMTERESDSSLLLPIHFQTQIKDQETRGICKCVLGRKRNDMKRLRVSGGSEHDIGFVSEGGNVSPPQKKKEGKLDGRRREGGGARNETATCTLLFVCACQRTLM